MTTCAIGYRPLVIPSGVTIEWHQNPLRSVVKLDDLGRMRLKLGIAADAIMEANAIHSLEREGKEARGYWLGHFDWKEFRKDGEIEAEIDRLAVIHEKELIDIHCGDCTCQPASCMKCWAESLLGFDTLAGLGKHEGYQIDSAFETEATTIDDALKTLKGKTWDVVTAEQWAIHIPRWRQERDNAVAWLEAYKAEHFAD